MDTRRKNRVRRRFNRKKPVGVAGVHAFASGIQIFHIRSKWEPHNQAQGLPLNPIPGIQPDRRVLPSSIPGNGRAPAAEFS